MTYIRMTGGRDRGYVKDFLFSEAQEMLALGQALPVDFNEPDPLGFRELKTPMAELQLAESQPPAFSSETTSAAIDQVVGGLASDPLFAANPDFANTSGTKFPRLVPLTTKKKR